jgi:hypothetical protein
MANTGRVSDPQPRLADLVGALSLATDLAAGLAYETALRTCLLAVRLGSALGVRGEALRDVYYTGLLRFIGCTAYTHETAARFVTDDMALLGALTPPTSGARSASSSRPSGGSRPGSRRCGGPRPSRAS